MTGIVPAVVELSGANQILVILVAVIALAALGMAAMFRNEVMRAGEGTDNMKNIAQAVQEGADAYLKRQFRTLGIFAAVAFVVLLALPADDLVVRIGRSIAFLVGAGFSAAIGYLDGWVAALVEVALVGSALILITRMRRRRGTWPTGNAPRELRRSTAVLVGGAIAVGLLCWLVGAQVSVFAAVVLAGVLSAALVVWYRREYAAGVAAVRRRLA